MSYFNGKFGAVNFLSTIILTGIAAFIALVVGLYRFVTRRNTTQPLTAKQNVITAARNASNKVALAGADVKAVVSRTYNTAHDLAVRGAQNFRKSYNNIDLNKAFDAVAAKVTVKNVAVAASAIFVASLGARLLQGSQPVEAVADFEGPAANATEASIHVEQPETQMPVSDYQPSYCAQRVAAPLAIAASSEHQGAAHMNAQDSGIFNMFANAIGAATIAGMSTLMSRMPHAGMRTPH